MQPLTDRESTLAFAPEWCLFFDDHLRESHLGIWLPYLRRSRYRYVVMATTDRSREPARNLLLDLPNVALVEPYEEARGWLKQARSLRGILYVGGYPSNLRMVDTYRRKAHVWLGHGESGKWANAKRSAVIYDSVLVAQYDAVKRFPPAIRTRVALGACAIGAPIVEGVVRDPKPDPRPIRTVLYAPTWEGASDPVDYGSLPEVGPAIVAALPALTSSGVKVILRPHPASGTRHRDRRERIDEMVAAGAVMGEGKARDFADADALIADISGVTAEFLFTEKPVLLPVSRRLLQVTKGWDGALAGYPWVDVWKVDDEDLVERLSALGRDDAKHAARAAAADRMFRGHRSIDEAVRSFDLALACASSRGRRLPIRLRYELRRTLRRWPS